MARFTILLTFAVVALSTLASGRSQKEGAPHNCFQPAPGQPLGVSHVHTRDIGAGVGNQTHDAGETLDARGHRHHRRPHHHGKRPHPHPKHHPAKGQKHGTAQVAHQDNAQQDTVHWGQDSNSWKLVKNIDHTNFFQEMDVFVGDDPSKGMVRYIGMDDARRKGLVNTDNGLIYMALSRRRTNGKYETIRPSTKMTFTEGLVIINVKHMPAACGGWPAIFTVAKDGTWPEKGEIDIAEGVHFYRSNKMSIHTNPGCHMEDWAMSKMLGDLGSESSKNCAAWETQDKGCAVQSSLDDFGISINQNGGGTYMMAWTEDHGIAVYHSAQVPADVASGRPDVSRWGKPTAYFPASSCTPSQFFSQHAVTITNTYGGTWAGNDQVWHWKATMDQSCAERTGHNSFWDYFHTGADLSQAYWSIQNIQIWQKQRKP